MKKSDFYFDLPERLIAQHPLEQRDASRLMVLDRRDGSVTHRHFRDLLEYVQPGDCMVFNNSRVIPARLMGHAVGHVTPIEVRLLTDKGDGRFTFIMPAGRVEVKAAFTEEVKISPFRDVPTDAYYYEAVKWAQKKGITGGIGDGLFGPNQPCTRAQIVTFLWRAAGSPVVNYAMDLADVSSDAYYAEAVRWALSRGITTGTADGKFSPNAPCIRAQSMTFLFLASKASADGAPAFSDVAADAYYAEAVKWATDNGITNGTTSSTFSPAGGCTRAQIVTFLWRLYAEK